MAVFLNTILVYKLAAFSSEKLLVYLSEEDIQSVSERLPHLLWSPRALLPQGLPSCPKDSPPSVCGS